MQHIERMKNQLPDSIRIQGKAVEPTIIRGVPCLNTVQSAMFVGKTVAGFRKMIAERVNLPSLASSLYAKQTFYTIEQLKALKGGYPIPELPETLKDAIKAETRSRTTPTSASIGVEASETLAPELIDMVVATTAGEAAAFLGMPLQLFLRDAKTRRLRKKSRSGKTYYAVAQIIALKHEQNIPDIPEWQDNSE